MTVLQGQRVLSIQHLIDTPIAAKGGAFGDLQMKITSTLGRGVELLVMLAVSSYPTKVLLKLMLLSRRPP